MSETRRIEWKAEERSVPALENAKVFRTVKKDDGVEIVEVAHNGIVQTGDVIETSAAIADTLVAQGIASPVEEAPAAVPEEPAAPSRKSRTTMASETI
jgi:hypothetical protein